MAVRKNYECQKYEKKSPIHENADANVTCDFGDGDIIRYRSRFTHTRIACSIIVRRGACVTCYNAEYVLAEDTHDVYK